MSEKDDIQRNGRINRRKFLAGVGAGTTAAVAGCGGGPDTPGGQDTPTEGDDTPTATDTPTGPQPGGKPVEGLDTAPQTLNPLQAETTYSFEVIDKIYDYGTTVHPDDYSFTPWSIVDWELNPDNIGEDPDNPAITANLRDDLSFTDGEAVTAQDYKFSVEYIQEQEVAGAGIVADIYAAVDSVQVDNPDGTTVNVFMTRKDNRWFTGILGSILLPQHIWKDVPDYTEYAPRNSSEGVVGSGPFALEDFSWENWFELSARPSEEVPWPSADYVDWIHEDAPFVDGVRVEIFGSKNAKEQALLNGDIDAVGVQGISVDKAVQAQQQDQFEVHQNEEAGYNHVSVNLRRVPFDDIAFRQLLRKLMDGDWIVEDFYKGIGAVKGDYASVAAFEEWRPPAPTEADSHEGIPLPDLEFPGEAGTFVMNQEAVQAARDFLVNHPEAKHDYSFGEGQTNITTAPGDLAGTELYVNGQHLNEAHTDNVGEGGQGPLVFSFQPPNEDLVQSRYGQRFLAAMKAVGIPVQPKVKTINAQLGTIYVQEDFDIYAMGWGLGVNQTHLTQLYSSAGADLGYQDPDAEPTNAGKSNAMGYTGADELINQDRDTLLPEDRKPLVRQILAQIWNDAPTIITEYANLLEPTNRRFTGYVDQVGGILSTSSWLNVRQNPEEM